MKRNLSLFFIVFFMFVLTIGLWQSSQIIVQQDQNERLLQLSSEISNKIRTSMNEDLAGLQELRSFLLSPGTEQKITEQEIFDGIRHFVDSSRLFKSHTGRQGIGYGEFARSMGRRIAPVMFFSSPLSSDWNNGEFNLFTIPEAARVLTANESFPEAQIFLVPRGHGPARRAEFVIVLQLMADKSFLFMPIDLRDRFEGVFGKRDVHTDTVNFVVSLVEPDGREIPIYERLGGQSNQGVIHRQEIGFNNIRLAVRSQPTPAFYKYSDVILPTIIGAVCFVALIFIFYFLRSTERYSREQEKSRKELEKAYLEISEKTKNLQRLVDMMKAQAGHFEMTNILNHFVYLAKTVGHFQTYQLYLNLDTDDDHLRWVSGDSLSVLNEKRKFVSRMTVAKFFNFNSYLTSADLSAARFQKEFLLEVPESEWIALKLCSRSRDTIGFLVLIRQKTGGFSIKEIESLSTLSHQASLIIENVWLYEKANEASRAKSEFLANMSHEIRTPLNAIIGFSDMLITPEVADEVRHSAVCNIKKNGHQLIRIIDDILDLSKIEAGRLPIQLREVNFPGLILDIQSALSLRAQEKNIELKISYESEIPKKILGDDVRIKQILWNILGNAIKFTDQGCVQLQIAVQGDPTNPMVTLCFTVSDTGVGINEIIRKKLFQSFTQGDSSHSRRFGGTGLGLVLSRRLAQEMGGDVWLVRSQPGRGSTFRVEIKVDQLGTEWVRGEEYHCQISVPMSEVPISKRNAQILLVEDSEDNQEIFEYFLKLAGHQVHTVDNGDDAVRVALKDSYDLILMDIQIPGLNGKEATARIREEGFVKPIVALTAHALPEEINSCVEAGCNGQITKPVSGEDLIKAVDTYLR